MNKFLIVVFIFSSLLFVLGLLDSMKKDNGGVILLSASILLASFFICYKLEELKQK